MAEFSPSDIENAKRRVMEMQRRASSFTANNAKSEQESRKSTSREEKPKAQEDLPPKNYERSADGNGQGENESDSTLILIILMILLSQEETDERLLLALLYLLF